LNLKSLKLIAPVMGTIALWPSGAHAAGAKWKDKLPLTTAEAAAKTILTSSDPLSSNNDEAWKDLFKASTSPDTVPIITKIAAQAKLKDANPPVFGRDWHYFRALGLDAQGKWADAVSEMEKLQLQDRFFAHGLYLKSMYLLELKKTSEAVTNLKAILLPETRQHTRLQGRDLERLLSYTNLALARIHYQEKDFLESTRHFRRIEKSATNYYQSLFEQSWSLFLLGFPTHSLGTLHGVRSPFFDKFYNPEAALLQAIVYYWMCDYGRGKRALAGFTHDYSYYAESLKTYTERLRFTPEQGYQLFEDFLSGVSTESLGIDRRLLAVAANKAYVLYLRAPYAALLNEMRVLSDLKLADDEATRLTSVQNELAQTLRNNIGAAFVSTLKAQSEEFQRLADQAEFLHLEMLIGEKDQLLGKNLEASLKIQKASDDGLNQWAAKEQSWALDRKNEFWWDEIGFQLIPVKDQCQ